MSHRIDMIDSGAWDAATMKRVVELIESTPPQSTRAEGAEREKTPAEAVKCDCGLDCEDLGAAGGCRYLPRGHMKETW